MQAPVRFAGVRRTSRAAVRRGVSAALHPLPVSFWRRLAPKTIIALCYHVVATRKLRHVKHYPVLSVAEFAEDLLYLQKNFSFISYDELAERRLAGRDVRDNRVIVTFDDGFAECSTIVAPMLKRCGASGVFFIVTDFIDNRIAFHETKASLCLDAIARLPAAEAASVVRKIGLADALRAPARRGWFEPANLPLDLADLEADPDPELAPLINWLLCASPAELPMLDALCAALHVDAESHFGSLHPFLTADQIRALHDEGFTIGAHSRSHVKLQTLSPPEAEAEIVESCRAICAITGQKSAPFAFPYSGAGLDRSWLAAIRAKHAFVGLFFDTGGLIEDEPIVVQRVFAERVGPDRSLDGILRREWSRRPAWSNRRAAT